MCYETRREPHLHREETFPDESLQRGDLAVVSETPRAPH
jgi:hypothetical protein